MAQANPSTLMAADQVLVVEYLVQPSFDHRWHHHEGYELLVVHAGSGRMMIGDRCDHFTAGDIYLLAPGVPHSFHTSPVDPGGPLRCLYIEIAAELLEPAARLPGGERLSSCLARSRQGLRLAGEATRAACHRIEPLRCGDLRAFTLILDVLAELASSPQEALSSLAFDGGARGEIGDRWQSLCRMVRDRFREPLSVRQLAGQAGISSSQLCAVFRKMTGHTLMDYVHRLRIAEACRLLLSTDASITDIALSSGYQALASFNRQFRSHTGMSPGGYRRHYRAAPELRASA